MNNNLIPTKISLWIQLLRWDKPSGRLILLIPAGWSLCLTPLPSPNIGLVLLIIAGGIFVSGAGCIANDLWDKHIDKQVSRTKNRPLASGLVVEATAWILLLLMLFLSLLVVISLPVNSRLLCLYLAILALPPIIIYPSAKRWFKYPQILLAFCWGFSVLIPWAASQGSLNGGLPLFSCWAATLCWTFGFDTVYAMADRDDDARLNLNSSALSLGNKVVDVVCCSYLITSFLIACSAISIGLSWQFWPAWAIATLAMQYEALSLKRSKNRPSDFSRHFRNQVLIGSLILFGLFLGKVL